MELNVRNRLLLLPILPKEGDLTTIRIVQKLREDLSFSEEEHEKLQLAVDQEKGKITWDSAKESIKDIQIGPKAKEVIVTSLETLSKDKKLTADFIPLLDLFIPEE